MAYFIHILIYTYILLLTHVYSTSNECTLMCNNKLTLNSYCEFRCECPWCTSTNMCEKLNKDMNMINNFDDFIKNISIGIKTICTKYVKEDWSSKFPLYSKITCKNYLKKTNEFCENCEVCNTELICNKTKYLLEPIIYKYPNTNISNITNNVISYCSYAKKINMYLPMPIFLFMIFTF